MQDQIKNLPKKYFQITDENKRDRMVAYVRLDEVLEIVNRDTLTYSEVTYNDIVPGTAILSEEALERAKELENNQE